MAHESIRDRLRRKKQDGSIWEGAWVGFDLDGTLAHYEGWVSRTHIGAPIEPMCALVRELLDDGFDVRIITARCSHPEWEQTYPEGPRAVEDWCLAQFGRVLPITCVKDWQMVAMFDDRCIQVEQNTGRILEDVVAKYDEMHDGVVDGHC